MITIKKATRIFVLAGIMVVTGILLVVFQLNKDFKGLEGEILVVQGGGGFYTPVIKYYPQKKTTIEIKHGCSELQYNANNDNNLIAIMDNTYGKLGIYEISNGYQGRTFENPRLLYEYDNADVHYPKFVPGKNAISFVEKKELKYYDLETKKTTVIAQDIVFHYDWLDSNTVLFTPYSPKSDFNILAYSLKDGRTYTFKKNAGFPALSYNKKVLAYRKGKKRNVVYIEKIDGTDRKAVEAKDWGVLPFKPSGDGKFLLAVKYNVGHGDLVIINTTTNRIRTIIPYMNPTVLEWKE